MLNRRRFLASLAALAGAGAGKTALTRPPLPNGRPADWPANPPWVTGHGSESTGTVRFTILRYNEDHWAIVCGGRCEPFVGSQEAVQVRTCRLVHEVAHPKAQEPERTL